MAVLDTSFLIDLESDWPEAETVLRMLTASGEPLLVPAIVAAEYVSGTQDELVNLHMIEASFTIVPFERDHVLEAARVARAARAAGAFPGWADVQIAALARLEGTYVITSNARHFTPLDCATWDPRSGAPPPEAP